MTTAPSVSISASQQSTLSTSSNSISPTQTHPASKWHTIRPWTPRLFLTLKEITSVSATFILSSSHSRRGDVQADLATPRATDEEDDEELGLKNLSSSKAPTSPPKSSTSTANATSSGQTLAETLSKGLTVTVNSVPTQRVLIRIDDKNDEAVVIVFGLMPGREYEIELGVVQDSAHGEGEAGPSASERVSTVEGTEGADANTNGTISQLVRTRESESNADSEDSNATLSVSSPSTSPSPTLPSTPPDTSPITSSSSSSAHSPSAHPPNPTIEEHLNHLHHSLSLLTSEHDSLLASLKSTRRSSQRSDSTLRSEIDVLNRTSQKHNQAVAKSRQKILALGETVRQAKERTDEVESLIEEIKADVGAKGDSGLESQRKEKEREERGLRDEVDRQVESSRKEREAIEKKVEGLRSELSSVAKAVEKLNAKKEKLEGNPTSGADGVLSELEQQIKAMEEELETVREEEELICQTPQTPLWSPSRSSQAAVQAQAAQAQANAQAALHALSSSSSILSTPPTSSHSDVLGSSSVSKHSPTIPGHSNTNTLTNTTPFSSPPHILSASNMNTSLSSRALPFEPRTPGTTSLSSAPVSRNNTLSHNSSHTPSQSLTHSLSQSSALHSTNTHSPSYSLPQSISHHGHGFGYSTPARSNTNPVGAVGSGSGGTGPGAIGTIGSPPGISAGSTGVGSGPGAAKSGNTGPGVVGSSRPRGVKAAVGDGRW